MLRIGKEKTILKTKELSIVRDLAKEVAQIASVSQQEQKRGLWRKLNGKQPERPMVMIDQVCWNEMNFNNELTLLCQEKRLREWENILRRIIYQWKHFPVDMVVENFIRVPKAVSGMDFGVHPKETVLSNDDTNDVMSHCYTNQFVQMEDLKRIKMPVIHHDQEETNKRMELASEIFDGIIAIRAEGVDPYLSVWDPITTWMGPENLLLALADEPEMMLAMAKKLVSGYLSMLDQLEDQGLLCGSQSLIHCTGAWTDDLPQNLLSNDKSTTKDIWMFGLAQMFASVSPDMLDEFEISVNKPLFERFGLVYYGCCDPLDLKMEEVRKIPNLRKVSMSTWVDRSKGAQEIGRDYVYSYKPNPAYLASASFDEALIRKDLRETKQICERYNCPLEIILKDVSTVSYQPGRLWQWAKIAMEEVGE